MDNVNGVKYAFKMFVTTSMNVWSICNSCGQCQV